MTTVHSAVSELVHVRGWIARGVQYDRVWATANERDACASIRCIWAILGLLEPGLCEGKEYPAIVQAIERLLTAIQQDTSLQPIERTLLETAAKHLRGLLYVIERERT